MAILTIHSKHTQIGRTTGDTVITEHISVKWSEEHTEEYLRTQITKQGDKFGWVRYSYFTKSGWVDFNLRAKLAKTYTKYTKTFEQCVTHFPHNLYEDP